PKKSKAEMGAGFGGYEDLGNELPVLPKGGHETALVVRARIEEGDGRIGNKVVRVVLDQQDAGRIVAERFVVGDLPGEDSSASAQHDLHGDRSAVQPERGDIDMASLRHT